LDSIGSRRAFGIYGSVVFRRTFFTTYSQLRPDKPLSPPVAVFAELELGIVDRDKKVVLFFLSLSKNIFQNLQD
jgi:hypothetical protein